MRLTRCLALLVFAAAYPCSNAIAEIVVFDDRGAWEAAVGSFALEDFNSINSDTFFTDSSISFNDLTLNASGGVSSDTTGILIDLPPYEFNPGTANIDGTARLNLGGLVTTSLVTINFDLPVTAFGFDTVNYDVSDDSAQVFVDGMFIADFPEFNQETGFIGVVSSSSFSEVSITSPDVGGNGTFNALDNVSFVNVPEPGSSALILTAGVVGLLRRRR